MSNKQDHQEEEELLINETNNSKESGLKEGEELLPFQFKKGSAKSTTGTCLLIQNRWENENIKNESNDITEEIQEDNDAEMIPEKEQKEVKDFLFQIACEIQGQPVEDTGQQFLPDFLEIKAMIAEGIEDVGDFLKNHKERKIAFQKDLQDMETYLRVQKDQQFLQKSHGPRQIMEKGKGSAQQRLVHSADPVVKNKSAGIFSTLKKWFMSYKEKEKKQK